MSYENEVKNRMSKKFPAELLGGTYRNQSYPHIFKNLDDNFIDGKRQIKKCLKGNLTDGDIKYNYAEHLNSSQTMCIAYFKKFFEKPEYEPLLAKILMIHKINLTDSNGFSDAVFEHIPCPKEGTNFDFYLKTMDGKQITWEIKFTESEFKKIALQGNNSDNYIKKYKDTYIKMLQNCVYYRYPAVTCDSYECTDANDNTYICNVHDKCSVYEFFNHYQIRRNILYARNKGDYVIFLTPRENKTLDDDRAYIEYYADKWGTDCIKNIFWEDLLETTLRVVSPVPVLFDYYKKFKEKYFD